MNESTIRPRNFRGGNRMRLHGALVRSAVGIGLALASSISAAQATQAAVTVYGGGRAGGDLVDETSGETITLGSGAAAALSLDWLLADGRQAQIFYSRQHSSLPGSPLNLASAIPLDVSYLQAGGRVFFDGTYATNGGYLAGGLGITYFEPNLNGLSSEVRPSMNLALGYQWMLSRSVALRSELRGYLTLINSSGGFFCSGGACTVSIRGDTLTQFEGLLGLSVGF
jgi:hypothetical protein